MRCLLGLMVRDGARAPPHHEGRAVEPPPPADRRGDGIPRIGIADTGAGANRGAAAAQAGKDGRILRHRAGFHRGQCAAAQRFRHTRPLPPALRRTRVPQRAGADLAIPRLRRPVGPAARRQGRTLRRHLRQGRLVHRPHRLSHDVSGRVAQRRKNRRLHEVVGGGSSYRHLLREAGSPIGERR